MQKYIGVKTIHASPMNRAQYNEYRGRELLEGETGLDEGYLVEYLNGGMSNHPNHDGYISWSPADVFEKAYRRTDGLSFGLALEALKLGKKVCRAGWNGKGMWLVMADGTKGQTVDMRQGSNYEKAGLSQVCIDPHIDMFTAGGTMQPGWLASQADMLADDWAIL